MWNSKKMTIREVKSRIYNSSFGKVLTCFCHHHSEIFTGTGGRAGGICLTFWAVTIIG